MKKLIAIICAVAVVATSLFGALAVTAVAEETATPEVVAESNPNDLVMPEFVDEFGNDTIMPGTAKFAPPSIVSNSKSLAVKPIANTAGLPFQSLYKVTGGANEANGDRVEIKNKGVSCNNSSGFMFYVEAPVISEPYTYKYAGGEGTSSEFHLTIYAQLYDASEGEITDFYNYADGMSIWTLEANDAKWKANSMYGYGINLKSGFKGYVYVPFTNLIQTGTIAEEDTFLGFSLLNFTASNNYTQTQGEARPLHGYIPKDQALVVSPAVMVVGALDTNISGDEKGAINGADNILPSADVVTVGGEKYNYMTGRIPTFTSLKYPSVSSAFTAHGYTSLASADGRELATVTPLLNGAHHSHQDVATQLLKDGEGSGNKVTSFNFPRDTLKASLSTTTGWVVWVDFSKMKSENEEMLEVWGASINSTTDAVQTVANFGFTNLEGDANKMQDNTKPYYYLAEGADAWTPKNLINTEAEAVAAYGSAEAQNNLILPDGFKGFVYFPNCFWRTNATYRTYFSLMNFTVHNTDGSDYSEYVISAPMYVSSFDSNATYAKGTDGQLVNLSTNTLAKYYDTDYYSPKKLNGNEDLLPDVTGVVRMNTMSLRGKHAFIGDPIDSIVFDSGTIKDGATYVNNPSPVSGMPLFSVEGDITETSTSQGIQFTFAYNKADDPNIVDCDEIDGFMYYVKNGATEAPIHLGAAVMISSDGVSYTTKYNIYNDQTIYLLEKGSNEWTTAKAGSWSSSKIIPANFEGWVYSPKFSTLKDEHTLVWRFNIYMATTKEEKHVDLEFGSFMTVEAGTWSTDHPDLAIVNGAKLPQNLWTGEFTVPNDFDGNYEVNLKDLVNAKLDNAAAFQAFRDSYLDNYVDDLKVEQVESEAALALSNNDIDYDISLMGNPDRGYRSEMVVTLAEKPLDITPGNVTPVLLDGTGLTFNVAANAINDKDIQEDRRAPVIETDYDIAYAPYNDRYPRGDISGGAVYTLTTEVIRAWIDAYNAKIEEGGGKGKSLGFEILEPKTNEAEDAYFVRAAKYLVSLYTTYELNHTMEVSELQKVVYLTDAQIEDAKEQLGNWKTSWSDKKINILIGDKKEQKYIRREYAAVGTELFYYDNSDGNGGNGYRVYDENNKLVSIKLHVYSDTRKIYTNQSEAEMLQRYNDLFTDYKIGYANLAKKTYHTTTVTLASGKKTIEVSNMLFNAYIDIGAFNTTEQLPPEILDALDCFFKVCRQRGAKANFRPSYNNFTQNAYLYDVNNPNTEMYKWFQDNVASQCAEEEIMKAHIKQIAPIIAANKDAIHNISSGWIGFGGEMAAGYQYPPVSYKNVITEIIANHCVPNGLYFSSRQSSYVYNITGGVDTNIAYVGGNLDMKGLDADPNWGGWHDPDTLLPSTEEDGGIWIEYIDYCGFNNDAFFGEQQFPGWGSGAEDYQAGDTEYEYDTANAHRAPNDGELYTNSSHILEDYLYLVLDEENGNKYVWKGYDNPKTNYNDTDNLVPSGKEAILELAHHRFTDLSQWHGLLETSKPTTMKLWMDHNAEWSFEGDVDNMTTNGGRFNATDRAKEITAPITKRWLDNNNIPYDPAWVAAASKDLNGDGVVEDFNAYEFIRDHLGYRIKAESGAVSISDVKWTGMSAQTTVNVSMDLKNYGFAAPFCMEAGFAILDSKGNVITESPITGDVTNPDKWIGLPADYYTKMFDENLGNDYVGSALANIKSYNVSGSMTAQLGKGTYKVAFYLRNSAKQGAQLANQIEYVNGYNVVYEFTVQ